MKGGGWVPISKFYTGELPHDRAYTRLEAAYCLQLDYDAGKLVTVAGYAALWQWSRKKVNKFLSDLGIVITYLENTKKRQNQKGQIGLQIRDRKGPDMAQIRLIDSKDLRKKKNRKGADKGQKKNRSGSTTIDPRSLDPNPNITYPDWLDMKTWLEFVAHRINMKAPMNDLSEKKNLNKLVEFVNHGHRQQDIINNTIANNWKGLFEPKIQKGLPQPGSIRQKKQAPCTIELLTAAGEILQTKGEPDFKSFCIKNKLTSEDMDQIRGKYAG